MTAAPFNAGDPAAVAESQDIANARAERDRADLSAVMSSPEGSRLLLRLLAETGPLLPGPVPVNAGQAAYDQGIRRVGVWLVAEMMQADPAGACALLALHAEAGP